MDLFCRPGRSWTRSWRTSAACWTRNWRWRQPWRWVIWYIIKKTLNMLFQTSGGRQEEEHQEEEGDQRRSIRGNGQGPRREGAEKFKYIGFFCWFRESRQKFIRSKTRIYKLNGANYWYFFASSLYRIIFKVFFKYIYTLFKGICGLFSLLGDWGRVCRGHHEAREGETIFK